MQNINIKISRKFILKCLISIGCSLLTIFLVHMNGKFITYHAIGGIVDSTFSVYKPILIDSTNFKETEKPLLIAIAYSKLDIVFHDDIIFNNPIALWDVRDKVFGGENGGVPNDSIWFNQNADHIKLVEIGTSKKQVIKNDFLGDIKLICPFDKNEYSEFEHDAEILEGHNVENNKGGVKISDIEYNTFLGQKRKCELAFESIFDKHFALIILLSIGYLIVMILLSNYRLNLDIVK